MTTGPPCAPASRGKPLAEGSKAAPGLRHPGSWRPLSPYVCSRQPGRWSHPEPDACPEGPGALMGQAQPGAAPMSCPRPHQGAGTEETVSWPSSPRAAKAAAVLSTARSPHWRTGGIATPLEPAGPADGPGHIPRTQGSEWEVLEQRLSHPVPSIGSSGGCPIPAGWGLGIGVCRQRPPTRDCIAPSPDACRRGCAGRCGQGFTGQSFILQSKNKKPRSLFTGR